MTEETARRPRSVLAACLAIEQFTTNMNFGGYLGSLLTRSAVERQLEIIGEALNRAAMTDDGVTVLIPELRQVVGLRNRLIHGYDSVDDEIVWDAIHSRLPVLRARVISVLNDSGEPLT